MHFKTHCVNMFKKYIFSACLGLIVLLPLFHHLNTNPMYLTLMGAITSLATTLIKAFTDQVLQLSRSHLSLFHHLSTNPMHLTLMRPSQAWQQPRGVFQRFMYSYYYCPLVFAPLFHHLNISLIEQTFTAAIKSQQLSS